MMKVFISNFDE